MSPTLNVTPSEARLIRDQMDAILDMRGGDTDEVVRDARNVREKIGRLGVEYSREGE